MTVLTVHQDDSSALVGYIFDIFAKYKSTINRDQLKQVVDVFGKSADGNLEGYIDAKKIQSLNKDEFLKLFEEFGMQTHQFNKIATLIHVELGLKPETLQD